MKVTVLFDLDDTLLENEMGVFLPAYFSLIQNSLGDVLPPEKMLQFFLSASQKMMEEQKMDRPLLEVFYDHFQEDTGLSLDAIVGPIEKFYEEVYPVLRSGTSVLPEAQQVVQEFDRRGYRLVVATNPFFPEAAVMQRIEWAELPVSRFDLVTANETFHFGKPDPAYYAEVLGYLGWPEEPVVMIGNDPLNDVQAASVLGLPTFYVDPEAAEGAGKPAGKHGRGRMADAVEWLDALDFESVQPGYRSPEAVLAIYRSTAAVIDTLIRRTDPAGWEHAKPGEWTAHQVLHHLMDVEKKVNLPRIQSLLSEPNPFISGVDTDAWYVEGFPTLDTVRSTFEEFLAARSVTLRLLSALDRDGWELAARHAIFGPTDLLEISFIMARHDQLHIRQLIGLLWEKG